MSLPIAALQFNFKGITGNTLPNLADSNYNGTINTQIASGKDSIYGDYLEFGANDSISLKSMPGTGNYDFSNGITVSAWVYMTGTGTGSDAQSNLLYLGSTGVWLTIFTVKGVGLFLEYGDSTIHIGGLSEYENKWVYLAVTIDKNCNASFNTFSGVKWQQVNGSFTAALAANLGNQTNQIGKGAGAGSFLGKVAWLSVYNQVLNQTQLVEESQLVSPGKITFRKSIPVDFSLTSKDGGNDIPVLFIEQEGKGKEMSLSIVNSGTMDISIPAGTSTGLASDTNFHFQLHFQAGVLSKNYRKKTNWKSKDGNWSFALSENTKTGNWHLNVFNLSSAINLVPGETTTINLGAVNADPLGGARNGTVMLNYDLPQSGTVQLKGHRKQTLSIVSHLGQKDIPLNVGIVGAPRILSTGNRCNLQIRLQNIGKDPIELSSTVEQAKAYFKLGFDIGAADWALMGAADISGVRLSSGLVGTLSSYIVYPGVSETLSFTNPITKPLAANTDLTIVGDDADYTVQNVGTGALPTKTLYFNGPTDLPVSDYGTSVNEWPVLIKSDANWSFDHNAEIPTGTTGEFSWTIKNEQQSSIQPGDYIEFVIIGIKSNLNAGQSFLRLQYYNIGGYWDGEFIIPIERSPISIANNGIGIGIVPDATNALEVADINQSTVFSISEAGGITVADEAKFKANINLAYPGTGSNGLMIGQSTGPSNEAAVSLAVPQSSTVDPLTITDHAGNELMKVASTGEASFTASGSTNNYVVVQYPDNTQSNGLIIGSKDSLSNKNVALGISGEGSTESTTIPFYIEDNSGSLAMEVDGNGKTTLNTLSVTGQANLSTVQMDYPPASTNGITIGKMNSPEGAQLPDNGAITIITADSSNASGSPVPLTIVDGESGVELFAVYNDGTAHFYSANSQGNTPTLHIGPNKYVGIGTSQTLAPLHVQMQTTNPNQGKPISIHALAYINAPGVINPSDCRIKEVKELSDAQHNLALVNRLQVKDYHYKDKLGKGNGQQTGLIAQEVAEVLPDAVSLGTEYIPSIYEKTQSVRFDEGKQVIDIQLYKSHELKVGDQVRLILEGEFYDRQVVKVLDDHTFSVSDWSVETDELFVFGKQVDDFHSVDYNAVFMRGISATQALSKEVTGLKVENESLRKEMEALKAANQALQEKLETELAAIIERLNQPIQT